MDIGIIGYGSMGKMLADKFASSHNVYVATRSREKLITAPESINVVDGNTDVAKAADIIFICVRPVDIKDVISEIEPFVKKEALLVSLNGSVTFELMEKLTSHKLAKVIPSVTAEIDRSQTLVTYNSLVADTDKKALSEVLSIVGNVIELPENEMGMGSELVSCMPGFIASIFDVLCASAKKHTSIPDEQIVKMVLNTMSATGDLMLQKDMTFEDVVTRVATKGGITEEGTKVVYEGFPDVADKLFENTLEKRRATAHKAQKSFEEG